MRTSPLLVSAALLFSAWPLLARLPAVPGALAAVALVVLLSVAASGGASALGVAAGALGAGAHGKGPAPASVGVPPSKVTHVLAGDPALAKAKGFSNPSTAQKYGGHVPSRFNAAAANLNVRGGGGGSATGGAVPAANGGHPTTAGAAPHTPGPTPTASSRPAANPPARAPQRGGGKRK